MTSCLITNGGACVGGKRESYNDELEQAQCRAICLAKECDLDKGTALIERDNGCKPAR